MRGSIVGVSYYTAFEYPFPQNHVFLPLRRWKRRLERDWFDRPYDEAADLAAVAEFERRSGVRVELENDLMKVELSAKITEPLPSPSRKAHS